MSRVDFRYKNVGYVALNVTDINRTHDFATELFGLDFAGEGPDGERFYRCGKEHHSVALYPAAEPGFIRCGWELESEGDVQRAFEHCQRLGLEPKFLTQDQKAPLGLSLSSAFRVREPVNKLCFEYYSRMQTVPRPRQNRMTEFHRFAHVGISTPSVKESSDFMIDNLGFIASDYVGDYMVAFMRPFPISDHHGFGYLPSRSGQPQFNHLAFLVNSIDDIGRLFNRVENSDYQRAFGMGRHPTSESIHLYINDPDGMLWEYSLGMEQFPETGARQARFMSSAPEDFDLWGAKPKPGFVGAGNVIQVDD